MSDQVSRTSRFWKGVQLFIGFHRDPDGAARAEPKLWPPKNARATIHEDAAQQEAFAVVRGASEGDDVQVKFRKDKIILRRDEGRSWHGVIATEHAVSVVAGDTTITIGPDGSVTRQHKNDVTDINADGSILKRAANVTASMSGDGTEISRSSEEGVAAIRRDGVVMKAR